MLSRQLRKFSSQATHRLSTKCSNNRCERCDMDKKYLETYASIFLVGGLVELYTYSNTKDINKSTGLGWATLAILLI